MSTSQVFGKSPELEQAITQALAGVADHHFRFDRARKWPVELFAVYKYEVGMYAVTLYRHHSFWEVEISVPDPHKILIAPLRDLLSDKRQVFIGRYSPGNPRLYHGESPQPQLAPELELHVYSDDELISFVTRSLPLLAH